MTTFHWCGTRADGAGRGIGLEWPRSAHARTAASLALASELRVLDTLASVHRRFQTDLAAAMSVQPPASTVAQSQQKCNCRFI